VNHLIQFVRLFNKTGKTFLSSLIKEAVIFEKIFSIFYNYLNFHFIILILRKKFTLQQLSSASTSQLDILAIEPFIAG